MHFTRHARDRMSDRVIPEGVVDMIVDFGERHAARDGAEKIALTKASMKQIRQYFGPTISDAMSQYRKAYVVLADGGVVTAAFAPQPIFR